MINGYGHIATLKFRPYERLYPAYASPTARRIRFFKKGYTGAVRELMGGNETVVKGQTGGDVWFGIRPTTVTISLLLEDSHINEFYAENDRDVFFVMEQGPVTLFNSTPVGTWTVKFMGWLSPFGVKEPYEQLPYTVEMQGNCGLQSLKDFPFYSYPLTIQFTGPQSIKDTIYNCLLWAGPDRPLWISHKTWNVAQTNSPTGLASNEDSLSWSKVQLEAFRTDNGWKSCHDALTAFCEAFNSVLIHDAGVWKFLRVDELPLLSDITTREWVVFDGVADYTGSAYTENPTLTVGPSLMPTASANVSREAAVTTHKVTFTYGKLYNILRNGDFSNGVNSWSTGAGYPGYAAPQAPLSYPSSAVGAGTEDSPYGLRITGESRFDARYVEAPTRWQKLTIQRSGKKLSDYFGIPVPVDQDKVVVGDPHMISLSFTYVNINTGGPKVAVWVYVTDPRGRNRVFTLDQTGDWVEGNKTDIYHIPRNVYKDGTVDRAKPTSGETYEIKAVSPVPGVGAYDLYVELHAGTTISGPFENIPKTIEYRNVRLTKEIATRVVLDKDLFTAKAFADTASKRQTTDELELVIGSQMSAKAGATPRLGGILNMDGETPAYDWAVRLPGNTSIIGPIQELAAAGRLRLTRSHVQTFEGELDAQPGPLALIDFTELGCVAYTQRYEWDEVQGTCSIRAVEVLNYQTPTVAIKRSFVTADGVIIPMSPSGNLLPANSEPGLSKTIANPALAEAIKELLARTQAVRAVIGPKGTTGGNISVSIGSKRLGGILAIYGGK